MTSLDLTGRTAIITGASRGIGLAIAQQLAAAGAHVVLTARRQEAADEAAAQVGDRALGVGAHAVDENAARRCVDLTLERFGSVDILINNAGTNPAYGPLLEQDHARFAKIFDVNLWAPLMWTSLVVTAWMGEHGGAVVNTASIGGMHQSPAMGMYNATKAALIHVTKQLALELSPRIRVNAICPGWFAPGLPRRCGRTTRIRWRRPLRSDESGAGRHSERGRVPGFGCRKLDHRRNHDHRRRSTARQRAGIPGRTQH